MPSTPRRTVAALASAVLVATVALPTGAQAKRPHGKQKPGAAKVSKRQKAAVRAFTDAVDYNGPIGAIVHFKTRTVRPDAVTSGAPDEVCTSDVWQEYGGGGRSHTAQTCVAGSERRTDDTWSGDGFYLWLQPAGDDRSRPVAERSVRDLEHGVGGDEWAYLQLQDVLARAGQSPAGPSVNGHATKSVTVNPWRNDPSYGTTVVLVDAASNVPLEIRYRIGWLPADDLSSFATEITSWEPLPAGSSDRALTPAIPLDAELKTVLF